MCKGHTFTPFSFIYMYVKNIYMYVKNIYVYVKNIYMYVKNIYMYVKNILHVRKEYIHVRKEYIHEGGGLTVYYKKGAYGTVHMKQQCVTIHLLMLITHCNLPLTYELYMYNGQLISYIDYINLQSEMFVVVFIIIFGH